MYNRCRATQNNQQVEVHRWCCLLLNHVWLAFQSPHTSILKIDACFQCKAVSRMYLVSLSWSVLLSVMHPNMNDWHLNSSRGISFPAVWKTFNDERVSHTRAYTHIAQKPLLVLDDWRLVANKGCVSSSLHYLLTYNIFHATQADPAVVQDLIFFLFHWNPSLCVHDKKLKRRQLHLRVNVFPK